MGAEETSWDVVKRFNAAHGSKRLMVQLPGELVKTRDEVYIRFHGLTKWYRHDYTAQELGCG
jgi:uncharacterized protein YecE (DUF72 family)